MKTSKFLTAVWNGIKSFFSTNIVIKILAVVFALLMWGYVLADQNPERSKFVSDVQISTEGANELLARSLILVTDDLGTVDVTVNAEITRHRDIDKTRISCVAKLNTITQAGTYTLPLDVTVQSGLGSVADVTPGTVKVEVDRLIEKYVPVKVEYQGTLPNGYEIRKETYPSTILVEGASRYITPIKRAVATVPIDGLTADFDGAVDVTFYDENGEVLDVVTRNRDVPSIAVQLDITAFRRVPIRVDISAPDAVYYVTDYVTSVSEVILWGSSEVLASINEIVTEPIVATVDMDGEVIETQLLLPDGAEFKTGYTSDLRVTVTVSERIETVTQEIEVILDGLSGLLKTAEPVKAQITLTGTVFEIEKWKPEQVRLSVDCRGLSVGEHKLPLARVYDGALLMTCPDEIIITLIY